MRSFSDILNEKVVVFDGAMGTNIQAQNLGADDFGGERYNGCNEYLVISKPGAVEQVHSGFLGVGCDVIETDSFGATPIVLAEYGLEDRAFELNRVSALLAKKTAAEYSTAAHPRFVAGSMGPTTKLPSLGHIGFSAMEAAYRIQAEGLLAGGVDILCVETSQDLLQAKAALAGIASCFSASGRKVPVIVSITIEAAGTMLLGTEIASALTSLEVYDIAALGMNCATGPKEMSEHVHHLCSESRKPVFVMPNAGIPENIGGRVHYHLQPEEFVYYLSHFVKDLGVNIVGGCCGTTTDHLRKLVDAVGGMSPIARSARFTPSCSSTYTSVPLHLDPGPVLIGERTNANGSKQFRELLAKEDWEGMVAMGKDQILEGAHVLDVCTAFVGRPEISDMREIIARFNTRVTAPIMIDSTEPPVIEEALRHIGGKAIVNSINLEDGAERAATILPLCRKYGAAVVALTIDEEGMAKTAERKLSVARRLHDLVTRHYGLREEDLILDALTFTLGSGDEEFRRAAAETLEAIRLIKREFPEVHTSLGVSNVSFGLAPQARHILNSVFLHLAVDSGLDMAIVNASRIIPLYRIPAEDRELCRKLIFDERTAEYDPLRAFLKHYSGKKAEGKQKEGPVLTVEERLKNRIIDGNKVGLDGDLAEALTRYPALDIINRILLDGMKTVGDLFGSGEMQLPFVLQSAEVMKSAVSYLQRFMEKADSAVKGTLIIATVKGDVHDIGKNLVDIILTNNGYRVVNLGIQCPLERMLIAAEEHTADAIGMSGLLVKSTLIMKENLEVMNERGTLYPVILGGAALTRRYVENDLRPLYQGELHYARDAFDGLRSMETILSRGARKAPEPVRGKTLPAAAVAEERALSGTEAKIEAAGRSPRADAAPRPAEIPQPPFWGAKVVPHVPIEEVFRYINETALIRGQWQVRKGKRSDEEYQQYLKEDIYPEFHALKQKVLAEKLLDPKVVYGYFPCQSEGNDLLVYRPESAGGRDPSTVWNAAFKPGVSTLSEWLRFTFPRQRKDRSLCISNFFAPKSSGILDTVAFHLVTMGEVASVYSRRLFDESRYKEYLYFHGLSVESAEALAELWHRTIRTELGIGGRDDNSVTGLFSQRYQGSRYSFGYPACPSLEDQKKLFELLAPGRIGVELTEAFQLVPEQSTSAIIVHHPRAKYFSV